LSTIPCFKIKLQFSIHDSFLRRCIVYTSHHILDIIFACLSGQCTCDNLSCSIMRLSFVSTFPQVCLINKQTEYTLACSI
jgi:hypothetical protein